MTQGESIGITIREFGEVLAIRGGRGEKEKGEHLRVVLGEGMMSNLLTKNTSGARVILCFFATCRGMIRTRRRFWWIGLGCIRVSGTRPPRL